MTKFKKLSTACCLTTVALTLPGCGFDRPFQAEKLPLAQVKKEQTDVEFAKQQIKTPAPEKKLDQSELFPGTNQFVPETPVQHRGSKGSGEGTYSLNFDEADLGEVAKVILSDILEQNYVLSPKVVGKVTLQTTNPLRKDELIPALEMVLRMNNAVLIKDARIYHIEPASEALLSSGFAAPGSAGKTGYQVRVIPIRNIAVQDLVDIIKPLVQEKTILTVDGTRNILVASGTPDELGRVMDMVSTFDIDVLKGRSFGLFPLAHVDPETMIKELEEIFNKKSKEKDEGAGFFRFIPVERLNAVMAITHQTQHLRDIENWILRLDRANTVSGGGVNVYKVQHADAAELANTLNGIFTGMQPLGKSAQVAPGQTAAQVTNQQPSANNPTATGGSSAKNTGSPTATGKAKVAGVGDVKIISDKSNNSLIIVAMPREYEVILPIIKQLDVLPFQVLIDATIVSVTLTDDLQYGIQWFLQHGQSSIGNNAGVPTLGSIATASGAAFATGGITAVYNSGAINALLSAQADKGNVNVISSPSLMVLNNQQAKINVGDQVPIETGSTSAPIAGGALAVANTIQYKDTGVTLDVTPRVNANGMVIMEVHQIVSGVVPQTQGVTTTATINKKEVDSSIAVYDGETIVLGGLISDDNEKTKSGIPLLYDIPWVGSLFGNTSYKRTKAELVILITPRVVKSKQDSRLISNEFKRKLSGIYGSKTVD